MFFHEGYSPKLRYSETGSQSMTPNKRRVFHKVYRPMKTLLMNTVRVYHVTISRYDSRSHDQIRGDGQEKNSNNSRRASGREVSICVHVSVVENCSMSIYRPCLPLL